MAATASWPPSITTSTIITPINPGSMHEHWTKNQTYNKPPFGASMSHGDSDDEWLRELLGFQPSGQHAAWSHTIGLGPNLLRKCCRHAYSCLQKSRKHSFLKDEITPFENWDMSMIVHVYSLHFLAHHQKVRLWANLFFWGCQSARCYECRPQRQTSSCCPCQQTWSELGWSYTFRLFGPSPVG